MAGYLTLRKTAAILAALALMGLSACGSSDQQSKGVTDTKADKGAGRAGRCRAI